MKIKTMRKSNNNKNFVLLLILLFTLTSCTKEQDCKEQEYRNNYIGEYKFIIHQINGDIFYGDWLDSTYVRYGFVQKYGEIHDSLLEIHYGTDTIATFFIGDNKTVLTENTPLKLSSDNTLSYPCSLMPGKVGIDGIFINYDSLFLNFFNRSIAVYRYREIRASKIIIP